MITRYPSRAQLIKQKEAEFQASVVHEAKLAGFLVYHVHDSRTQEWGTDAGFPDLVLVRPPLVLFAELKDAKGQPSPEQCEWLEALQHCNRVEARLWRPDVPDWQEIDRLLGVAG